MNIDDKLRKETIKNLQKIIFKKPNKDEKEILKKIEQSIFNFSLDYAESNETPFLVEEIYKTKVDEIGCSIQNDKLNYIKNSLKKGIIDPLKIAKLKPEELNPQKYEKIIMRKNLNKTKKATSDAFKCSKCGKRKCQVTEKQLRRGDEPATVFVNCLECGHQFRL